MTEKVDISICIPAYKNINYLKRLLNSIADQTFTNYEVVVTDDSPDDSVKNFIAGYQRVRNLRHFKNATALGTPENWNEGIRRSTGRWIKLMHDDDWFTSPDALRLFYKAAEANPTCSFFFSAFQNVVEKTRVVDVVRLDFVDQFILRLNPLHLFKKVYVGNPSCTFIRSDVDELYDNRFKFVVDFEYYIRLIKKYKQYKYIDEVLLNIGFNDEQVTKYTFLVAEVQVPENLLLLEKLRPAILRNIIVYDYYWRMFRNLKIRSLNDVKRIYPQSLDPLIVQMIKFQTEVPLNYLKIGLLSKPLMVISYMRSLFVSLS
jgi:glycosyltransferase involved in cell wall biosynthesis